MKTAVHPSLLIVLACLLGAACTKVGPDYASQPPAVPSQWHQLSNTSASVQYVEGAEDLSQWWRVFADPPLSDLISEALQASPDLRLAEAKLREARSRRQVTKAGLFPEVSASGSGSRSYTGSEIGSGESRNLFSAGFDASWELDVFGGLRRSVEAAEADLETAAANLDNSRVSLVAEVALNYIELRGLQLRLGIARRNLASQSETLQLTEWRAEAGLVSSQDVEQARSNREQTKAQIPSLGISLTEAEHRLDILLGKTPGSLHARLADESPLPNMPKDIAVAIPADVLRQRPDIRAAERQLAAETARLGVAEAARYPSFKLSGSIGLEALSADALANRDAAVSSLLAGITAPIFDAGRLRSQVEIQDAVLAQTEITYQQAVLTALEDVENALLALSANSERKEALTNAADAARKAAQMARQQYSAGLIDFQSLLDTERSVLTIEDSLASTSSENLLALIRLYKALGGGWSYHNQASQTREDKS